MTDQIAKERNRALDENLLVPCSRLLDSGATKSYEWRVQQLGAMRQMIINHKREFLEALKLDLGKTYVSGSRRDV